jgi:hypothetical protein
MKVGVLKPLTRALLEMPRGATRRQNTTKVDAVSRRQFQKIRLYFSFFFETLVLLDRTHVNCQSETPGPFTWYDRPMPGALDR